MKRALLNVLKLEKLERLTVREKGEIVNILKKKHKLSYRDLEEITGIPYVTLFNWATGRYDGARNIHVTIDMMIRKLEDYKPKLSEFPKLEKLKKLIEKILILDYGGE